jgi:serine O-acetyltransferase
VNKTQDQKMRPTMRAGTPERGYVDALLGRRGILKISGPFLKTDLRSVIRKAFRLLRLARAMPHLVLFKISPVRPILEKDMERYIQAYGHTDLLGLAKWRQFAWIASTYPEFRTVLYYRVEQERHVPSHLVLKAAQLFYAGRECFAIRSTPLGPGLFIEHGYSTVIGAKSIGANCWINQEVTIGHLKSDDEGPTIGNNVRIAVGAKVLGAITIGDNCVIGPNSFVHKSIPPNCTVIGVPAYIIKRDGKVVRPRDRRRSTGRCQRKDTESD